jgi:hypothetical protein
MNHEGPQIDALTHRLAECPPEFLETPRRDNAGTINVGAIVADHLRQMGDLDVAGIANSITRFPVKRQQLAAIGAWLLNDPWFLDRPELAAAMRDVLTSDALAQLAETVRPEQTISDPDRREEFARICLRGLGLRPQGESMTEAADRLGTLDSVEREQVVRKTRAAEARARKIREEMASRAAQEAATRYSRE